MTTRRSLHRVPQQHKQQYQQKLHQSHPPRWQLLMQLFPQELEWLMPCRKMQ